MHSLKVLVVLVLGISFLGLSPALAASKQAKANPHKLSRGLQQAKHMLMRIHTRQLPSRGYLLSNKMLKKSRQAKRITINSVKKPKNKK